VLNFSVTELKEGRTIRKGEIDSSAVDLQDSEEFHSPIQVSYVADKIGEEVFIKVNLKSNAELTCDRCLELYHLPIEENIDIILTQDRELLERDEEDIFFVDQSTRTIDISGSVRQTLLLAIPFKKLCREDCKGLCPHCGQNLNIAACSCILQKQDPRWDVLSNLKFEQDQK